LSAIARAAAETPPLASLFEVSLAFVQDVVAAPRKRPLTAAARIVDLVLFMGLLEFQLARDGGEPPGLRNPQVL
jgi:hypothetical protein